MMADFTPHQKKIVDRYYANRDDIMFSRLGEIVTEFYLAETDRRRDQLWKRAEQAMKSLKIAPAEMERILSRREPEVLARCLRDWLSAAKANVKTPGMRRTGPSKES